MHGIRNGARFVRGGLATLAVLLVAACGSESTAPEPAVLARYALSQINGVALPAVVFDAIITDEEDGDSHMRVVATQGSIELRVDETYVQSVNLIYYIDGVRSAYVRYADRGTYHQSGSDVMFESGVLAGVVFHGAVQGENIVADQDLTGEGVTATYGYQKQQN